MQRSRAGQTLDSSRLVEQSAWAIVNLLQGIFLGVWSILLITLALVALAVTMRTKIPLWLAKHGWAPLLLRVAGVRLEVRGIEQLHGHRRLMFMANHQSMIDIAVAFAALPSGLRFVAKRDLLFVPFLGWYMWAMGMVFVERQNRRRAIAVLERASSSFGEDALVMAFPEGTRARGGEVLPFKKGLFRLAIAARLPVVPVAIRGADRVLPSDGFHVRPGVIRINIGEPIATTSLGISDHEALLEKTRAAVLHLYENASS
ncbi:MAG: lysophospholipid acyltransferase family protein [Myxococcota bacterium]